MTLAPRKTIYRTVRTIYGADVIDRAMGREETDRRWQNETLGQSQDVREWIEEPAGIDSRIVGNLCRFSGMIRVGDRILDVGCYGGYAFDWLKPRTANFEYVGIDVNAQSVAAAGEAHKGTSAVFATGDLFDLGPTIREHGPFDAALCLRVVIHTPHLHKSLAQLCAAAPVILVGLRMSKDDEDVAIERHDELSGKRHFFRWFSRKTVTDAVPKGFRAWIHNDGSYQSLVLVRG